MKNFFEATVDLEKWKNRGYKQLPVNLTRFPDFSKMVKIEPQQIDFIITK